MLQLSTPVRDARLDVIEATIGVSGIMEIRTGPQPANCAAADTGTVLATITLPVDWMAVASGGSKALSGTWEDLLADATGIAAHYRIKSSGGTCHVQGSCTMPGGGGNMVLDNTSLAINQPFRVVTYTWTDGNP